MGVNGEELWAGGVYSAEDERGTDVTLVSVRQNAIGLHGFLNLDMSKRTGRASA